MKKVTEQEYREAQKIVDRYIEQLKFDRLSPYKGCTKDDILWKESTDMFEHKIFMCWVSKGKGLPNRNPDNVITQKDDDFYTIERSNKVYENHEDAKKAIIQSFKRKKLIDNE